jgi:hypothetical protein
MKQYAWSNATDAVSEVLEGEGSNCDQKCHYSSAEYEAMKSRVF